MKRRKKNYLCKFKLMKKRKTRLCKLKDMMAKKKRFCKRKLKISLKSKHRSNPRGTTTTLRRPRSNHIVSPCKMLHTLNP